MMRLGNLVSWAVRLLLGAVVVIVAGFVLAVLLVTFEGRNAFPAPLRSDAAIARHMPDFRYREAYEVGVDAEPEELFSQLRQADLSSVPVLRLFLEIGDARARVSSLLGRGDFRRPAPLTLDSLGALRGFRVLEEQPGRSIVLGTVRPSNETPGPAADSGSFSTFASPGFVKYAVSLEAIPRTGGGSRVALEWRVIPTDLSAMRGLGRAWLLARPFTQMVARTGLPRLVSDADSAIAQTRRKAARGAVATR